MLCHKLPLTKSIMAH